MTLAFSNNNIPTPMLLQMAKQAIGLTKSDSSLWPLPIDCTINLINLSENATFLITTKTLQRFILRIHRHNYHSQNAIASELAWLESLHASTIEVPIMINGRNGQWIQESNLDGALPMHYMVLFEFIDGLEPNQTSNLQDIFTQLGTLCAMLHQHSKAFTTPNFFSRPCWDLHTINDKQPIWGPWRDAPNLTPDMIQNLKQAQDLITLRLEQFGTGNNRFGLIHADMRLANLLYHEGKITVIDFDDCGFGWYLYDFAASISFFEDHPDIETLKQVWLNSYQKINSLSNDDIIEIDTFIMFRRLLLLGWIGSHQHTQLAQSHAPYFAANSAELAKKYLNKFSTKT